MSSNPISLIILRPSFPNYTVPRYQVHVNASPRVTNSDSILLSRACVGNFQHLFVVCLQIILFPYEWNINTSRNLNELFVVRYVTVIAFLFLSRCQVLWINTVHRWNIWYLQNIIWILSRSEKWSKIFGSVRCNLDVLQWPMDRKWIVWMGCFMGKLHAQLCLLVGGFKRQA